jgi:t-SNARE complex subunit (syntaxin)
MAVMSKFQSMQSLYQGKYRQQLERQYLIVKPQATKEELDRLTHGGSADATVLLNQQIFSMANRAQAAKQLAEMQERHHDIISIEKSIRELHQMFVDMAIIVEQQGELIDKVEDHVANTAEYTEHAAQEMRQAVIRQRGVQKKKWIILIILVILLTIIGLVIYFSIHSAQ